MVYLDHIRTPKGKVPWPRQLAKAKATELTLHFPAAIGSWLDVGGWRRASSCCVPPIPLGSSERGGVLPEVT